MRKLCSKLSRLYRDAHNYTMRCHKIASQKSRTFEVLLWGKGPQELKKVDIQNLWGEKVCISLKFVIWIFL